MALKKVVVEANANYHRAAGENLFEKNDPKFSEYRKKWKENPEKFEPGKFPLFIDVEVTSVCNLKCPFCATTYRGPEIKRGFISPETVKKIIDEGADNGLYGVKFNIRGEPLLHPQIYEFVKYAKQKGLIDVYFNTNAMLLTEEASRKLIDSGLDRLSVSFEGMTKQVYEGYRVGARYETVLKNIETMQQLKRDLGVDHPKIRVQTVLLPEIKDSFEEYKRFWAARADEVGYLDYKEMKKKKKNLQYSWACPQIWQRMAIWWDGTLLPCNHDDDALLSLGNVKDIAIRDAWNSPALNKVRKLHRSGAAHEITACDGCYLRDSEILKIIEQEKK